MSASNWQLMQLRTSLQKHNARYVRVIVTMTQSVRWPGRAHVVTTSYGNKTWLKNIATSTILVLWAINRL